MTVSYSTQGRVGIVTIDRPPVNAIDETVRAGLLEAVRQGAKDNGAEAILLVCAGRTFLSGADLKELDSGAKPPTYRETLAAIEDCAKPTIACLHGTALGGGLETALACHYRCAVPGARMGMPEITLGLVPGAGGTQRLPRLVGSEAALDLLLSGRPVDAERAAELGLIDEIIDAEPLDAGLAFAERMLDAGAGARRTRENSAAPLQDADVAAALEKHARALKGRTTQDEMIRAVKAAGELSFEAGLDLEKEISDASLSTTESRALRHVFFAERECARIPDLSTAPSPVEVKKAAVIGAGTMGGGIAVALADSGLPVTLIEVDEAALERGMSGVRSIYEASLKRGRISQAASDERLERVTGAIGLESASDCDLVIEAVFEDIDLKRSILSKLDQVAPAHAVLASNTSSLSVTELGEATNRPDKVIGLHFFSPANVMRLLEIVRGDKTSIDTIATGLALAKALRKVGVVVGDGFGFVGNRMMLDGYFREVELMLLERVDPMRIDRVLEDFGFAMGPNRVNDMAGVDVGTKVRTELAKREDRKPPYHAVSDALTPMGRLGQKTGKGVYRYEKGDRTPLPDPEVEALIAKLAEEHGIAPREVSDEEIVERCVLSLVNIGAQILDERLAYRASDVDVIWTSGYGFPRWRGGPLFYADTLGLGRVADRVRHYHELLGDYWSPSPLLVRLTEGGKSFSDYDRQHAAE